VSYLDDLFTLKGKVAAIFGGCGVLGGEMAIALASSGAKVAFLDRNKEGGLKCKEKIEKTGGEATIIYADVLVKDTIESAYNEIRSMWGGVDILVNAAGVNSATPVLDIDLEEWEWILSVNLKGVFLASQVFGKAMIEAGNGGTIINISSVSSEIPLSKVFSYSISKAGVNNLTKYLAREWAPYGIRVNAIMPGFFPAEQNRNILTEDRRTAIMNHTPMKRFGRPCELAGAVVWLASDSASSFVTGAIIPVDGGFTAMTI
jgi:NAD(P)-dependent dehydrogenase (short-subunit alcohol dehydrogenase family)